MTNIIIRVDNEDLLQWAARQATRSSPASTPHIRFEHADAARISEEIKELVDRAVQFAVNGRCAETYWVAGNVLDGIGETCDLFN